MDTLPTEAELWCRKGNTASSSSCGHLFTGCSENSCWALDVRFPKDNDVAGKAELTASEDVLSDSCSTIYLFLLP